MMGRTIRIVLLGVLLAGIQPLTAFAHCDALDGPVVNAARAALDSRDVSKALSWVTPGREAEVREAFARTLRVRRLGGDAQALADAWFFETLVRIHRAGEGAPFDGLKPAGHIDPLLAAVDQSLEEGAIDEIITGLAGHVSGGIRDRFERAREAKAHAEESVEAGRRFVAAYVDYVHHVEGIHRAATGAGAQHTTGAGAAGHAHSQ